MSMPKDSRRFLIHSIMVVVDALMITCILHCIVVMSCWLHNNDTRHRPSLRNCRRTCSERRWAPENTRNLHHCQSGVQPLVAPGTSSKPAVTTPQWSAGLNDIRKGSYLCVLIHYNGYACVKRRKEAVVRLEGVRVACMSHLRAPVISWCGGTGGYLYIT